MSHLLQSNSLDLDGYAFRQLIDSDTRPSRLVRKPLLILTIHLSEVRHVCDEDLEKHCQRKLAAAGAARLT